MRYLPLLIVVSACGADLANSPGDPPGSVRERLQQSTQLLASPPQSTGSLVAERQTGSEWDASNVDVLVESGGLKVRAHGETITLEEFGATFLPIDISKEVFGGHAARIENVHIELVHPVSAAATWTNDDEATFHAAIELTLSWSLAIDGGQVPLGAPKLPPVPVEIVLTGSGAHVEATMGAHAVGKLWSWASLVRLSNLDLMISAATPSPGD